MGLLWFQILVMGLGTESIGLGAELIGRPKSSALLSPFAEPTPPNPNAQILVTLIVNPERTKPSIALNQS